MKRLLISSWPAILLLFLIASCGKEKSAEEDLGQYHLKCKMGSVDKTFNFYAEAIKEDLGGGAISYQVLGNAVSDRSNLEGLAFTILLNGVPFTTGTYKETDPTDDYAVAGIYNPNTMEPTGIFASRLNEANPFQVTITEITTTTLSGTFKGKLFENIMDPSADSAVIANGSFKVKFRK